MSHGIILGGRNYLLAPLPPVIRGAVCRANCSLVPLVIAAGLWDKGDLHISFVPGNQTIFNTPLSAELCGKQRDGVTMLVFIFEWADISSRRRRLRWGTRANRQQGRKSKSDGEEEDGGPALMSALMSAHVFTVVVGGAISVGLALRAKVRFVSDYGSTSEMTRCSEIPHGYLANEMGTGTEFEWKAAQTIPN